jgi:hypothetical protein
MIENSSMSAIAICPVSAVSQAWPPSKPVLLALLIAYGLGFALLTPLAQESARISAADGDVPMLLVGP